MSVDVPLLLPERPACACAPCDRKLVTAGLMDIMWWAVCRPLPPWEFKDYLGWMEQGDGKLAYGVYVQVRQQVLPCACTRGRVAPVRSRILKVWDGIRVVLELLSEH